MQVRQLTTAPDLEEYGTRIKRHPEGTLWQSPERKAYLEALGKEVRIYVAEDGNGIAASALVTIDKTSFGLSTWEIPRGPVFEESENREQRAESRKRVTDALLERIIDDAKQDKCLALYLSPLTALHSDLYSLISSRRHVHCEATLILNLTQSEEELLAQMKPKGRYNIRIAEKHGIIVRQSHDIDAFHALVKETSSRDRFTALPKEKYRAFLEHLPNAFLLLAHAPGKTEPIAGLLGVFWNKKALYYYGASCHAHRAFMAPYALQWEAMRFCKQSGCETYDLLGIAPPGAPADHPWQGITSFKEKFGGTLVSYPPEQEIILRPVTKRLLDLKRKILG